MYIYVYTTTIMTSILKEWRCAFFISIGWMVVVRMKGVVSHDYGDALTKRILFFEGQRSGKLPPTQRMTWRKDFALSDGSQVGLSFLIGLIQMLNRHLLILFVHLIIF